MHMVTETTNGLVRRFKNDKMSPTEGTVPVKPQEGVGQSLESLDKKIREEEDTLEREGGEGRKRRGGAKLLVICFLGIFVSYFVYGLLQEKM